MNCQQCTSKLNAGFPQNLVVAFEPFWNGFMPTRPWSGKAGVCRIAGPINSFDALCTRLACVRLPWDLDASLRSAICWNICFQNWLSLSDIKPCCVYCPAVVTVRRASSITQRPPNSHQPKCRDSKAAGLGRWPGDDGDCCSAEQWEWAHSLPSATKRPLWERCQALIASVWGDHMLHARDVLGPC